MAELTGLKLATHLGAILAEYENFGSIYGYPKKKFYRGYPGIDFSVDFHHKEAATPLGPASGPHTQMVQNIILSFLGGGRIMELKTIQILDQLEISRPCIDARNIGYNIEWSQELRLEDSYNEYVMAWVLLKIIEEMELLGVPRGDSFYNTVFDISVGYDLKGISSPPVHNWLKKMKDAGEAIGSMLQSLPPEFEQYRNLSIDPHISETCTLSTFHGCPPQEIEAITEHLISEHQFHTIVKKNPTLLGYEFVNQTLCEDLGYTNIIVDPDAFPVDLQFDEGVAMMKRLEQFAEKHGVSIGSKFTNTLVLKNNQTYFKDKTMYLSGTPLHVLAMNAMHQFRMAMGKHYHISFSAGISNKNFADAVSCNMKPVSVCTDLLKTGGYTRMSGYLKTLKQEMEKLGASNLAEFIIKRAADQNITNRNDAGFANSEKIVPGLIENPYYHFESNKKEPPRVDSQLGFFDCITCNKCLPVCPNAANFYIAVGAASTATTNFKIEQGSLLPIPGNDFVLKQKTQIANLADFCNECGDCDPYCPENGGPYQEKPRFFFNQTTYDTYPDHDGFYFPNPNSLQGRFQGKEYLLSFDTQAETYKWQSDEVDMTLDHENHLLQGETNKILKDQSIIDMNPFYVMKSLLHGIIDQPLSYPAIMLRGK
ncbi:MAG: glutamate synthase [SAR324 cluster bacterium]|nr:glutamate synthase [SAR324 cluster bacterium]